MPIKHEATEDPIARWISEALLDDEPAPRDSVALEEPLQLPDAPVEDAAFLDAAERFLQGRDDAGALLGDLAGRLGLDKSERRDVVADGVAVDGAKDEESEPGDETASEPPAADDPDATDEPPGAGQDAL